MKRVLKVIVISFGLCLFGYGLIVWRVYTYPILEMTHHVDAIVVLGASQWDGVPSPVYRFRLDHGLALYEKGIAESIILTGGIGEGNTLSESKVGRMYLVQNEVPAESILIEEVGHTSLQSLREVKHILNEKGFVSVVLVSDRFHMMRLKKMADDLLIDSYVSPTPLSSPSLVSPKYFLREGLVYLLYLFFKV